MQAPLANVRALLFRNTFLFITSDSCGTRGGTGALPNREVRSRAARHVAVPEPSRTGRHRSPLDQRGGDWAARRVAVLEPSWMGRPGPVPQDTQQRMDTRPASYLSLELVCGITSLHGANSFIDACRLHALCSVSSTMPTPGFGSSTPELTIATVGHHYPELTLRLRSSSSPHSFDAAHVCSSADTPIRWAALPPPPNILDWITMFWFWIRNLKQSNHVNWSSNGTRLPLDWLVMQILISVQILVSNVTR
jgi:hypothetical protein